MMRQKDKLVCLILTILASCYTESFRFRDSFYQKPNDDDLFIERHYRKPRDKNPVDIPAYPTSSPTSDDCSAGNDGVYGDQSTIQVNIDYSYEVEYYPINGGDVQSTIVPAIEKSISDSLVRGLFPQCSGRVINRKLDGHKSIIGIRTHSSSVSSSVRESGRRLEIQGITPFPPDVVSNAACTSPQTVAGSDCAIVIGGMSFWLDEGSSQADVTRSYGQAIDIIQNNIIFRGTYNSAHENIINIVYVPTELEEDMIRPPSREIDDSFNLVDPEDSTGPPIQIIIAGVLSFVVASSVIMKKRKESLDSIAGDGGAGGSQLSTQSGAFIPLKHHDANSDLESIPDDDTLDDAFDDSNHQSRSHYSQSQAADDPYAYRQSQTLIDGDMDDMEQIEEQNNVNSNRDSRSQPVGFGYSTNLLPDDSTDNSSYEVERQFLNFFGITPMIFDDTKDKISSSSQDEDDYKG